VNYKVLFSPEAQDQLAGIEDYIAEAANSPDIAARFVDAIVCYGESLTDFSLRGLRRDDLVPGLRITNYRGRVVVAFLVDETEHTVFIVGVFYGGQDYENHLLSFTDDTGTEAPLS